MILSNDARRLWDAASGMKSLALDRLPPAVSVRARALPPVLVFTDPDRMPRPWDIALRLPAGAGMVYRHFGDPDAETVARRLRAATRQAGVMLLIGMDADLADRVGADGVHLPERALAAAYALGGRRPDWVLTGAVHSAVAAGSARDLDAVVLSPVFPAGGASTPRPALGEAGLATAAAGATCPVYALGGIGPDNIGELARCGAWGVAGVEAFAKAFGEDASLRT